MEVLLTAIKHVFSPVSLLLIFGGVFFGLLLGAIPGLTATMAVGLIIPITFGLRPELAFPLLLPWPLGISGLVSASLIGIRRSSSGPTFEPYAMTKVSRGFGPRSSCLFVERTGKRGCPRYDASRLRSSLSSSDRSSSHVIPADVCLRHRSHRRSRIGISRASHRAVPVDGGHGSHQRRRGCLGFYQ